MQGCKYQEEGSMGATLAHPLNRVIRMLKPLEILENEEQLKAFESLTWEKGK